MFKNLSIKARLIFLTGLLSAVAVTVGVVGLMNQSATNAALGTVYNDRVVSLVQLTRVLSLLQQNQSTISSAVLAGTAENNENKAKIEGRMLEIEKNWKEYADTYLTPEEKVLAADFNSKRAEFVERGIKPALAAMGSNDEEALRNLAKGPVRQLSLTVQASMRALIKLQEDVAKQQYDAALARYEHARNLSIVLLVAGTLVGVAAAWFLIRGIGAGLAEAIGLAKSVATGDLTRVVKVERQDEIGQLLSALGAMNSALVGIVTQVRTGTDTIGTASDEIAAGNQDLSSRTEQQASSLEETAASMEELTSAVKQNADNARQANTLAQTASSMAARGGDVIQEVVTTMGEINDASRKIADIIGVIDGIAFQTNILALNAAVEAARAGEQGRGFAVVASEVRNLAQRSAGAAKEIKALIENSVERVNAGGRLVEQAGTTMEEIVSSVQRVTDIMGEISAATTEQTSGIEQVNMAVTQMDQVTQQNAALVEEAAAAAEAMREQAQILGDAVAVFRTSAADGRAVHAPGRLALAAG
jgi:methyl-accepting chemotaxis protein-1 (serine sensor receptor)